MPNRSTHAYLINLSTRSLTWIESRLARLAQQLFAASDASAREYGWQTSATHHGFGRKYRDPRFDTLISCPYPQRGSAAVSQESCRGCRSVGRVGVVAIDELPLSSTRASA